MEILDEVKSDTKIQNEISILKERLDQNEMEMFNKLFNHCKNNKDIDLLLLRYRHRIYTDKCDQSVWGAQIHPALKRPICIGYLLNEDGVIYDELDTIICNYLRNEGALVIQFRIEDFCYKASKNGIDIYIKNELCKFDGFMSYGYRKKTNMDVYFYIVKILQEIGVICLNDHDVDLILDSKLLQSIHFAKAKIPIPDTYQTFELKSTKSLVERVNLVPCVAKQLSDYCGDGIVKLPHNWNIVSTVSKALWKGENILLQKFVNDSIGRSIRVLCFNGKTFSITQYQDTTGDFRSNFNFDALTTSLMDHPKFHIYADVAERAVNSIGDLLVAGVDLVDSESQGVLVIEINSWPEIFETWEIIGLNTPKKLAESFVAKIEKSITKTTNNDLIAFNKTTNNQYFDQIENNDLLFKKFLISNSA